MDDATMDRLFGWRQALDEPIVLPLAIGLAAVLVAAPIAAALLSHIGRMEPALRREIWKRYLAWLVMIPAIVGPILLGAAWTIGLLLLVAILCYREFARALGLFREKLMSATVVLGIAAVFFAVFDHWYGLFVALPSLTLCVIALAGILRDQPKGYVQRVGLSVFSYLLFGVCLGHLAYLANDIGYRSLVLLLIVATQMSDVFAFSVGKTLGGPKLAPGTSPNKTISGSIGALLLTTALVYVLGTFVFRGTPMDTPAHLIGLGLILGLAAQAGDLMISSVKRDVGIKDMGVTIPGHGGVLDRFNSVLLASPAFFHYVGYFNGIGLESTPRILTGGL